mmetsp:Transcript_20194/g.68702  ORF Transcript_20194/g.68702 Transcript_20194/m.68702 type:complete len:220 (+) Transcript_20194:1456-2115(+)
MFLSSSCAASILLPWFPVPLTWFTMRAILFTAASTMFISSSSAPSSMSSSSSATARAPMICAAFVLIVLKMRSSGRTTFWLMMPFSTAVVNISSNETKSTRTMLRMAISCIRSLVFTSKDTLYVAGPSSYVPTTSDRSSLRPVRLDRPSASQSCSYIRMEQSPWASFWHTLMTRGVAPTPPLSSWKRQISSASESSCAVSGAYCPAISTYTALVTSVGS